MSSGSKRHCCVSTCISSANRYQKRKLVFYSLPADTYRRRLWLKLIAREDLLDYKDNHKNHCVCEEHFSEEYIVEKTGRQLLTSNAIPSICLPVFNTKIQKSLILSSSTQTIIHKTPNVPLISRLTQTFESISPETSSHSENTIPNNSQKRKLEEGYKESKMIKLCEKFVTNELTFLVKAHEQVMISSRDSRYYEMYKSFCLKLYYTSSEFYRLMQSTLSLPEIGTLFEHFHLTTEINHHLLIALHIKVAQMTGLERHCIMVIDSIPLTPNLSYDEKEDRIVGFHEINGSQIPTPAVKALVVMVCGMFTDWKQPIGYALLSNCAMDKKLPQWINQLVFKLCEMGLIIRVLNFVTEVEAEFIQKRWGSVEGPYFFIKNRKIFHVNDPAMLATMIRNCMLMYDLHFYNRVAKYEHILQFYAKDMHSEYRLAPKLTRSHICPTKSELTKACFAIDMLSKSVASGLSAYIDNKEIDEAARGTVELLTKISELFDCLNSLTDKNKNNRVRNNASRKLFLKQMFDMTTNWKFINSANELHATLTAKIIRSFQITIRSILLLMDDLEIEKCDLMSTRTLNQGVTEEFFNQIRLRNGNVSDPDIQQFVTEFTNLYILYLKKPFKRRNGPVDHDKFMKIIKKNVFRKNSIVSKNQKETTEDIPISYSDVRHIDTPERHTLMYVSGYLLKKCRENHKHCEILNNYIEGIGENITINNIARYIQYSRKNKISLIAIPCDDFVQIIEKLEERFLKVFKRFQINCKMEQSLSKELHSIFIKMPCPCFPKTYLIKLYIRIRITYTLQLNNRELSRNQTKFVIPLLLSV